MGFPGGSLVKNLPANAWSTGDAGSILRWERCPGEDNDNPLQYSCLENPMDREAWRATVHRVSGVRHDWARNPSFLHRPYHLSLADKPNCHTITTEPNFPHKMREASLKWSHEICDFILCTELKFINSFIKLFSGSKPPLPSFAILSLLLLLQLTCCGSSPGPTKRKKRKKRNQLLIPFHKERIKLCWVVDPGCQAHSPAKQLDLTCEPSRWNISICVTREKQTVAYHEYIEGASFMISSCEQFKEKRNTGKITQSLGKAVESNWENEQAQSGARQPVLSQGQCHRRCPTDRKSVV